MNIIAIVIVLILLLILAPKLGDFGTNVLIYAFISIVVVAMINRL